MSETRGRGATYLPICGPEQAMMEAGGDGGEGYLARVRARVPRHVASPSHHLDKGEEDPFSEAPARARVTASLDVGLMHSDAASPRLCWAIRSRCGEREREREREGCGCQGGFQISKDCAGSDATVHKPGSAIISWHSHKKKTAHGPHT